MPETPMTKALLARHGRLGGSRASSIICGGLTLLTFQAHDGGLHGRGCRIDRQVPDGRDCHRLFMLVSEVILVVKLGTT